MNIRIVPIDQINAAAYSPRVTFSLRIESMKS